MITQVSIKELFTIYNYDITFHNDVSIIYGLNGCGKTTILKMINCLFSGDYKQLTEIEFKSFTLSFDDGSKLHIERRNALDTEKNLKKVTGLNVKLDNIKYLKYTLSTRNETFVFPSPKEEQGYFKLVANILDRRFYADNRIYYGGEGWDTFEKLSELDKRSIRYERYDYSDRIDDILRVTNEQIDKVLSSIKVHFITADRLKIEQRKASSRGELSSIVEARVIDCAKEISSRISKTMENYGYFSQNNDRTFPFRVISEPKRFTLNVIEEELILLEERREHYISIGILDPEPGIPSIKKLIPGITEENMIMLSQYIVDSKEKLDFLEELSNQISLFKTLVEKKLVNKKIVFNKEKGFYFIQNQTEKVLDGTQLSSGEQQELIMLYDMIFRTSTDTLILIDEPELSLHIKWQLEFIDDLLEIIKTNGFKAIIATHSPQIIDNRWDLTIALS